MKVILTAFAGKLTSEVMDIPENCDLEFDMVLENHASDFEVNKNESYFQCPPSFLKCKFVNTGKLFFIPKLKDAAIEYALCNISKV